MLRLIINRVGVPTQIEFPIEAIAVNVIEEMLTAHSLDQIKEKRKDRMLDMHIANIISKHLEEAIYLTYRGQVNPPTCRQEDVG